MAAPNMDASRLGAQDGSTGSFALDNALFLKVFGGEVMTAFDEVNVMAGLHIQRAIASGKTAQFPATWKTDAAYHTPGTMLIGNQSINHNERTIHIDDILVSDVFIAQIDELKNHYDIRAEYAKQMGAALSRAFDKRAMQVAVLAARASATVTGGYGGAVVNAATMATDAAVLAAALYTSAQTFDEKDVPEADRVCLVKPAQYFLLLAVDKLLNSDYGQTNGDYARARVQTAAGLELIKSNNVPSTNIASATTGENNTYHGDFSDTVAIAMQRSAIGTVKLMDLVVSKTDDDGDFMTMYNGTLLTAKYALGTGILRPESSIEISKTA